ncbi:MAG: putative bifunctional diguanylate cyclase/phosphodiesterase [Mobilitalea sp.]
MMDKQALRKTVPDILKAIKKTFDITELIRLENQLACMFASPIMFLGMLMNFVLGYLIFHQDLRNVLLNSFIFLTLGIMFELLMKERIKLELTSLLISILYCLWFLFLLIRLYHIIGPAVWMIACIQIVFAMSRIKRSMAVIIGFVTLISGIYCVFNASAFYYETSFFFFIPQSLLLLLLFLVLSITHKINSERYLSLRSHYELVSEQKSDITALYEEITATEEELRQQNEQLVIYTQDIKKGEEKLQRLAYYDVLTGLPNRMMFMEQLDLIIKRSKEKMSSFYIVFIDVDSFKKINDTMGHHIGDKFLLFAADNLKHSIKEEDLLGRIGGDEFALIISRKLSKEEVLQELEVIRTGFYNPFDIYNGEIRLTASFGIAIYPEDGDTGSTLLKSADMSMYKAKEFGRNNVQFFSNYMLEEMLHKTEIENRLLNAMKNNEFYLVFQPQFCVYSDKIRGFETLARWKSPELGLISPLQFIPIAEETGFINILGEWILRTACKKFKELQKLYDFDVILCVNISTIQIENSKFIEIVKNIITETGFNPSSLELEITESVIIESFQQTVKVLNELKELGIRIALDDFGMGYSSLNYLKSLPIDTLKIDKSFIDDLSENDFEVQIVGDIISLGHTLGFTVIAEGVEHHNQLQYLKDHSCDHIQGFLYAKPLDEEALNTLLTDSYMNRV